jgi:hypothetical protein
MISCCTQEASQLVGPPLTAGKKEEICQLEKAWRDKIRKKNWRVLKPERVTQIVDLFNRTMDEMGEGASGQLQDHPHVNCGREEMKKWSRSFMLTKVSLRT